MMNLMHFIVCIEIIAIFAVFVFAQSEQEQNS